MSGVLPKALPRRSAISGEMPAVLIDGSGWLFYKGGRLSRKGSPWRSV